MKIKVCGMTDVENLKEILEVKPDFVGFIFYNKSSRNIESSEALEMNTKGVKKVGVFVNEEIEELVKIMVKYKLDYAQLHGDESPEYCNKLKNYSTSIIKAVSVDAHFDFNHLKPFLPYVKYFLFDTKGEKRGGNGVKFNWDVLSDYHLDKPFFLSGGITEKDADEINKLKHPQLFAVDINSGFEISPGVKNPERVKHFVQKLTVKMNQ